MGRPPRRREQPKPGPPPGRFAVPDRVGQQLLGRLPGPLRVLLQFPLLLQRLEPRRLLVAAGCGGVGRRKCRGRGRDVGLGRVDGVDRIGRVDPADVVEVEVGRRGSVEWILENGRWRGRHCALGGSRWRGVGTVLVIDGAEGG